MILKHSSSVNDAKFLKLSKIPDIITNLIVGIIQNLFNSEPSSQIWLEQHRARFLKNIF